MTIDVDADALPNRLTNDPAAWSQINALIARFGLVIKGELVPNLRGTVRAAEEASAILFCAAVMAKQRNIELGFMKMIGEAKGNTFGAQLINWAITQMDGEIADDLKIAWSGQHQHMSSAINMMIDTLEPLGTGLTPEQGVEWIRSHGGLGSLHMQYMSIKQAEARKAKKLKEEKDQARKREETARRLTEAKLSGFDSIEEYDIYLANAEKEKREAELKSKFGLIKRRLVKGGTLVDKPSEGKLVITSSGKFYELSESDEYLLLSCIASVL
jgi:hypothetical protein